MIAARALFTIRWCGARVTVDHRPSRTSLGPREKNRAAPRAQVSFTIECRSPETGDEVLHVLKGVGLKKAIYGRATVKRKAAF
jgi:hypothetical protein